MTTTRWILATLHLLGFGLALGSAWARGTALRGTLDLAGLRRVFLADTWWGISAIILIGTGVVRAFGGLEKGTAYYLHNHLFHLKLALVAGTLLLELGPMVGLIRWRIAASRGLTPDTHLAARYATISRVQAFLVAVIVALAAGVARGFGGQ